LGIHAVVQPLEQPVERELSESPFFLQGSK
jgi:hypothetical protein